MAQGRFCLLHRDVAAADEGLGVVLAHGTLGVDELVHQRLRERGVVRLVVPAATVRHEIDDDVLVEGLAELEGQARDAHDGLGVVAVDVEDGRLDHARHVGRVDARAAVAR